LAPIIARQATHISTREGIELVIDVSLNLLALIETRAHGRPKLVQGADEFVEVAASVVVWPERLPVVGIIAAMVTLLCTVVDNWNTLSWKRDRRELIKLYMKNYQFIRRTLLH
jgi:hypothetical protein